MKTLIVAATLLLSANFAHAAYECSAVSQPANPRTRVRTVFATAATRAEARTAAMTACTTTATNPATCKIIRCTPAR